MQFPLVLRVSRAGEFKTLLDTGGVNQATAAIRTGTPPGIGNALTGTNLATLTAVTATDNGDGTVSLTATADSSADASGTPGYTRFINASATAVAEVTAAVGSGELSFDQAISENGEVSLATATVTEGNA